MSDFNVHKTKILDDKQRTSRNYRRECPKLANLVTYIPTAFIAAVTTPKTRSHDALRYGSGIIVETDKGKAELLCTILTASNRTHTRIYSLIDPRPFEIATLGAELPKSGSLMAAQGGPFARVYRLLERSDRQGRWDLRPVVVFVTQGVKSLPPFNAAVVSAGKSARGKALRLKPWHFLTEGPNEKTVGDVRVV